MQSKDFQPLRECPFCGGNEHQIDEMESFWDKNETSWRVLGIDCIAETAGDTKEQAIAAWNRRSDAVPVVRGEWVSKGGCRCDCSVCGGTVLGRTDRAGWADSAFCGYCGAKMEGEKK